MLINRREYNIISNLIEYKAKSIFDNSWSIVPVAIYACLQTAMRAVETNESGRKNGSCFKVNVTKHQ